jgi:excisionase family DNA binding protein
VSDHLLTASELAKRWAVPETWIRRATRAGLIPYVPLGRYRRYDLEKCDAWLAAQMKGGAAWRSHVPGLASSRESA